MDLKITPSGQTIVKPTALGPVANTDTKLLIYGLFQKGRVLAQDGVADGAVWSHPVSAGNPEKQGINREYRHKLIPERKKQPGGRLGWNEQ